MLRILVEGVVMMGKVGKVGLEETEDLGTRSRFEIFPVFTLQPVFRGEFFLCIEHKSGEAAGHLNFNDAHMKLRRDAVERVTFDERAVCGRGIAVAAFVEIEFAEVAVNTVLIAALAVFFKVIHHGIGAAKIREALADDPEGVVHTLLFLVVFGLGKIIPRRYLVIQKRDEQRQALLIELLLVEGPAELVQGELVERRTDAHIRDALVGCFRIEITLAGKEVFGPPELHLIEVAGMREIAHQQVHDRHGLFDLPQFLIATAQLVQDPVVPLVTRELVQQLFIQRYRLPSPRFFELIDTAFGKPARFLSLGGKLRTPDRPLFKIRLRLRLGRLRIGPPHPAFGHLLPRRGEGFSPRPLWTHRA
jgi:hypothetical protein